MVLAGGSSGATIIAIDMTGQGRYHFSNNFYGQARIIVLYAQTKDSYLPCQGPAEQVISRQQQSGLTLPRLTTHRYSTIHSDN